MSNLSSRKSERPLRRLWYTEDIVEWIKLKQKLDKYDESLGRSDPIFIRDMTYWNKRYDGFLQHKEDPMWEPYCCSDEYCSSRAWNRMERTIYGWYCPFCGTTIGKHRFRIDAALALKIESGKFTGWSFTDGMPKIKYDDVKFGSEYKITKGLIHADKMGKVKEINDKQITQVGVDMLELFRCNPFLVNSDNTVPYSLDVILKEHLDKGKSNE